MFATVVTPARHPADAELLAQAVAGSAAAADSVLSQLGSANPWLQQIMLEAIQDTGEAELWQQLLHCLAHKRWGGHADCRRRADHAASQRIDAAIIRLFAEDEAGAPSPPVKQSVLEAALASDDCRLRTAAGVGLGMRGDMRGLDALVEAVHTGDAECQAWAIRALGHIPDEHAGWALVEALACDDDIVHHEATRVLSQMGAPAVPALIGALGHGRAHVRWHAARALGNTADACSAEALAEALADDEYSVRWAAADALPNLGTPGVTAILQRLARYVRHDDTFQAAGHALRRLAMGHDPEHRLEPLLKALSAGTAPVEVPRLAYHLLQEWESHA